MTGPLGRFEGRRIAVIGAAAGQIGGAIVSRLAAEGATLVIGGRNLKKAEGAATAISGPGRVAEIVRVDIADADSVSAFMDTAASAMGGLDGVANNAAMYGDAGEDKDAVEIDLASLDKLLAVNLRGQLLGVRYAVPHLKQAGGGSIVLTSSMAGLLGEPTRVSYGMAKAGIMALTRHVTARWGKQNIRCNTIVPGRIVGDAAIHTDPSLLDAFLRVAASPRLGEPGDIAAAAAFLLSDDAAFINGTNLVVDGGMSVVFSPAPADDDDFYPRFPFSRRELGVD